MTKFGFSIRTRTGHRVDNIVIQARDRTEAERRLMQMYLRCEVLDCQARPTESRVEAFDVESVISLIEKQPPAVPNFLKKPLA